ncbi:MAG: dipeptide/oligopeptide/nickel ABC transporter ATP-binding protein [Desulfarculus sp.]|nr:dipeptide/oligopeptide/nickel ABC transporter ATP-binding protein [Desulfarculus sp.]
MPEALLRLEGVGQAYPRTGGGQRLVLAGVDWRIDIGQSWGLMGPSGAGKSTLARICLGLERPRAGRVLFQGRDLAALDRSGWRDFRRRVQIVWQEPLLHLNPFMRVAELVEEPLLALGVGDVAWRRKRVVEMLVRVGLDPELASRRPHQLSGGQGQRLALARALVCGPDLLVCDEALNGLDTISQAQIARLLQGLVDQQGMALLFIAHDRVLLERICRQVAAIKDGRIAFNGAMAHPV